MKHVRLLALLLALLMCLSACGTSTATTGPSLPPTSTTDSTDSTDSSDSTLPAAAEEDVVYYLTDGAYAADTVVATAGDVDVTAAEVLYWLAYQRYSMTYYYYYYYYTTISMDDEVSDGYTVGEYLLDLAMESAVVYAVAAAKAQALGVELSEDDQTTLDTLYSESVQLYGEDRWDTYLEAGLIDEDDFTDEEKAAWITEYGTAFYNHSLMYFSVTADGYQRIYQNLLYLYAVEDALFADDGEYAATEENLQAYVDENEIFWGRCILFATSSSMDDDEVAEVLASAEEVLAELSELSGDELIERFTELQSEYDTSGYTAGEVQYYSTADSSSYVTGYISGLWALEVGEVGITDQTSYGFFVLLREEDQLDDVVDDYIDDTFDSLLYSWEVEYDVTLDFSALDLDSYYTNLAALQSILATVDTVSSDS